MPGVDSDGLMENWRFHRPLLNQLPVRLRKLEVLRALSSREAALGRKSPVETDDWEHGSDLGPERGLSWRPLNLPKHVELFPSLVLFPKQLRARLNDGVDSFSCRGELVNANIETKLLKLPAVAFPCNPRKNNSKVTSRLKCFWRYSDEVIWSWQMSSPSSGDTSGKCTPNTPNNFIILERTVVLGIRIDEHICQQELAFEVVTDSF